MIRAFIVMDGRRHEEEFSHLSAFNAFLRRNKPRIYGVLAVGGGEGVKMEGMKIRQVMNMHGIEWIG